MALHEQTFNQLFGKALREQFCSWRGHSRIVRIETTGQIEDRNQRPDVVVIPPGGYPVVFEGAFEGTADVDADARRRIGIRLIDPGLPVYTSFVIVIPMS